MNGARVLLVVSGGIAAYKAAALTSTLVQKGASVDVILTADAERFIAPLTFAALTARPVYSSLWDAPERIPHIRLVREAEVAIVAPATANIIAKLRAGIADDLATTALLAARIPVLIAPAMNAAMYENEVTVENIATLKARGYEMIEPDSGFLAEREHGVGRLASEERLLEAIEGARARRRSLLGKRVLITAGPSQEPFDPVRFIGNASTGATGIALADEAARRGAEVTLLLGPTLLAPPYGVRTERFATAQELLDLALRESREIDLTIAAAAVADWRPSERSAE
ncbi:MAG: bifunctional phosphopantothenoylcysteine decarboxylase/phosphopantothenate--cysteine ligase CoaBC, partial [Candidatus Eremiobacteraeota bacterium]|nr:bifunctional phosphopantothenoylcysteine decarboxylase/phosphopantothenate--cysteine ligase CoaBC [Candidatus Eremiobacteraeota bacterium]